MKNLTGEFDAAVWVKEFVKLVKNKPEIATDETTMLGWFANAIMAGYDNAIIRYGGDKNELFRKRNI